MKKNILKELLISGVIILIAVLLRLLPHPPNFAPIGALALFSGVHLYKKSRFILPLSVMIISDFFLKFHATVPFVYISFLLIIIIGIVLKNRVTVITLFGASVISSILFFLITNLGVWAVTDMYQKNLSGLIHAYTLAVPFFRNTIFSDLIYTYSFFYGYQILKDIIMFLPPSKQKSTV